MTLSERHYGGTSHTPSAAIDAAIASAAEHALGSASVRVLQTTLNEVSVDWLAPATWPPAGRPHLQSRLTRRAIPELSNSSSSRNTSRRTLGGRRLAPNPRSGSVLVQCYPMGIVYV